MAIDAFGLPAYQWSQIDRNLIIRPARFRSMKAILAQSRQVLVKRFEGPVAEIKRFAGADAVFQ
ncbi:hypothetical protein [Ensifer sp. BR816]|uniref:hypothetical protein n=1 Tax=Rhizobium sp. (strain BR816) TaxID=1057002 RepID=UPI00039D43AD|nr:hypothetical protein [Ensifer sp. BR816]